MERPVLERPQPRAWWVEDDPIQLTLTANAGILAAWQGKKLLVDGLHNGDRNFSAVPPALLEAICTGRRGFDGISWLLYTHLHWDHFSGRETLRFLQRSPVQKIFLPAGDFGPGIDRDAPMLRQFLVANAAPMQELRLSEDRPVCYPLDRGLKLTAFRVPHAAEEFEEIEHYCFLLELGRRNLFFMGDSDYDVDLFREILTGRTVETAVINPLFLSKPDGRAVLLEAVRPQRLVVNHIPFHGEDPMGMRRLTARLLDRWGEVLPPAAVLWEAEDTLLL
ncbi:hypothetical protein D1159_11245 [Pseudoflavonifractor sp. 524-17]|uniref:MBL fold metallo-hydrolase n=1 Tax=Pseudoflavonifractor sp. 524-17 TaxID=2304577 RepID=UPI00137A71A6|nr:MBL fold metallo-hydrolase [Pseudoflavonifractor sp. 524-17]NCE65134.1 hypothetical protein [Pseudoflavonifractor sp. 524-17]